MRTNSHGIPGRTAATARIVPWRLAPTDDPDNGPSGATPFGRQATGRDDLSYRVELWDGAKTGVEQVLAITISGSIGYAAYYAATREFPDRYITLRHKDSIVSRWNGPA
jgi:hypothetical protein